MMTCDEAVAVCEQVLALADCDAEATASIRGEALLRFANNEPIEHGQSVERNLEVRLRDGGRFGEASGDWLLNGGVAGLLAAARAQMAVLPPEPDLLPSVPGQPLLSVLAYQADASLAAFDAEARAAVAGQLIGPSREAGLRAAGVCAVTERHLAKATSGGMRGRYASTRLEAEVTAQSDDSTGWGWCGSRSAANLTVADAARRAVEVALRSREPAALEPGSYRVVLGPEAVATLLGFVASGFNARAWLEGRNYLVGRLGEDLFSPEVNLTQDICHPALQACPFDDDGLGVRRVELVHWGRANALLHDRRTAAECGADPTGPSAGGRVRQGCHATALVMDGGEASEQDLIAVCGDGLYINRFWYTNWVDPRECVITGMTRDGTFRIRDGQLAEPLTNARFNQNLLVLLRQVLALGRPVARPGVVAPALLADGFTISSGTTF